MKWRGFVNISYVCGLDKNSMKVMMKKLILMIVVLGMGLAVSGAELVLRGTYYGYNLHVLNPSAGKGFCVYQVLVNDRATQDEIESNAFEIDLAQLNLKVGEDVTVVIKYQDGCKPTVVNPKALQVSESFSYVSMKMDRIGALVWVTKGDLTDDAFVVEQFRWNKWVKVGEVSVSDTLRKDQYLFSYNQHSGVNQLRVVRNDANGNPVYSKVVKYTSKAAEVTLESSKVTDKLVFSAETQYEIFDMKGNFVAEGMGSEVDLAEVEKGKYWLNYDTKSVTFVKK